MNDTPEAVPATPPPAGTRRRRGRVWWWLLAVVLLVLALPVALLLWAGSEGSLPRALHLAQRFLPAGQQLAFTGAQGSITGGGRIGSLQWSRPGMALSIEDFRLDWSLRELLHRELTVRTLSARRVQLRTSPQPQQPGEPFRMPPDLSLPIRLTVPLDVARLEIQSVDDAGAAGVQVIEDIALRYRYDGAQHQLRLEGLRYGQSRLRADARLQARTLDLAARVEASLRNLVPDAPLAGQLTLAANGSLAGGDDATLDVMLEAREDAPPAEAALLKAQASIHPWRSQPAQQVDLELSQFNAHAFLAAAPTTLLRGRATVQPVGADATDWNAEMDITNDRAGAWDRQRLPLRHLVAMARLSLESVDIATASAEPGGTSPAGTVTLEGHIALKPALQPDLQLTLAELDLRPLMTSLPRTAFSGTASVAPWQQGRRIRADIRNALPGPLDAEKAPLRQLLADLRMEPAQWHVETFDALVGEGRAQVRGDYAPQSGKLDLRAELRQLPLRDVDARLANDVAARLSGSASVAGTLRKRLDFQAQVSSQAPATTAGVARSQWDIHALEASGSWSPTRLTLERVHADAFQSAVEGSDIEVSLPRMEEIRGRLVATTPGMQLDADTAMRGQEGGGKVSLQLASAEQVEQWLRGLPFMAEALPPLRASGAAQVDAEWQGGWRQWLDGIKDPGRHPQLRMNATAHTDGVRVELPATDAQPALAIDVGRLDLDVQGNLAAAQLAIDGDARANDFHAVLAVRASTRQQGGSAGAPRWNIDMQQFAAQVTLPQEEQPWDLKLSDDLQLVVQAGEDVELRASAGDATLLAPARLSSAQPLKVAWQPVVWHRTARGGMTLQSTGTVTGLQPAWLDALRTPTGEGVLAANGMHTDLVLRAEWNVQMTDHVEIRARLQREGGDLTLADSPQPAGVRGLDLAVQAMDENVKADFSWDTQRAGVITASLATRLTRRGGGWSLPPESPLEGSLRAQLRDLSTWAFLVPPGWRIEGALDADAKVSGTVGGPLLAGGIEGNGLNIRSVLDGVDLHGGRLSASLQESRMEITELTFEGGTGSRAYVRGYSGNRTPPPKDRGRMTATGRIDWSGVGGDAEGSGIDMDLDAKLHNMQVLVRHDRQMTLSGELSAKLAQGQLQVRGDLEVDRAAIQLPEASAPTLGDDVKVVRTADLRNPSGAEARARGELDTRRPLDMEVKLDLGHDLALEGEGITTRLEGELIVRSAGTGSAPFTVFGEVRTDEGRYRAWGQDLDVETGVVRFNGSYANPALDLLAIRPNIEVRAGVRVTGSLLAPRVQLYSEPELPEGEKLSWVVLGRASVITGAEGTSMQQAALGLAAGQLSGRLASGLGVDELGLSDSGVSIGKRISNELYLTYQQGLAGAASTLFIFYDITRKLTVRGQASEGSAVDLVYTFTFD